MATVHFKGSTKDAMLTQIINAIDAGGAAGSIKIYSGVMPVDPSVAPSSSPTHKLLGTLPLSYPCGTITANVLNFSTITPDSVADDTATAAWARIATSAGVAIIDVDVSTAVGSGAIKLNTTSIIAGGPISLSTFVISVA